jgi:hypothetical protein
VGPVFIRRGDVLFVIKSPEQFLESLRAGKFFPTDQILVKDKTGTDWIPLKDVEQFRLDIPDSSSTAGTMETLHGGKLFDRIRRLRFNLSAFSLGGFWYFFHSMPDLAWKRLLLTTAAIGLLLSAGWLLNLPAAYRISLLLFGWFSIASLCAVRADHDFNRLQVKQYRDEIHHRSDPPAKQVNRWLNPSDPLQNPAVLCTPTRKEKILN